MAEENTISRLENIAATDGTGENGASRATEMGYQTSVMYGRYHKSLADYAREQASELRRLEKERKKEDEKRAQELMHQTYRGKWTTRFLNMVSVVWRNTFARLGEDWVFLALLGITVAIISYAIDYAVGLCIYARRWYYSMLSGIVVAQYFVWIGVSLIFVIFSVGFVSIVAPQAVGSGIPEMKTIMRGVHLKEYLTFRTGIAKVVGLIAALGSGLPLGKEGPLVHIASIVATMMSKMVTSFKGIYENESRNSEMLAAACAVGLAVNFAAPIGGVLFSIEVTSVYFAIRNYWRGFFSAVFGALTNRLLTYWFKREGGGNIFSYIYICASAESITATYRTDFQIEVLYHPQELVIFVLMGAIGGVAGAFYVLCHRKYVLFMRNNKFISNFLKKNRFIYPTFVSIVVTSLYFQHGIGDYLMGNLTTKQQIIELFSNFTWYDAQQGRLGNEQAKIVSHWTHHDETDIILTLGTYMISTYFLAILASTVPVPNGSMFPIFRIGAAFGRLVGETMHRWILAEGMIGAGLAAPVLPGGYAIVGAAAFSAGVTHTISVSIVICEMTGHIKHVIPILLAVLVSNAVSSALQPSFYESLILIKKLPFLPDILSSNSAAHTVYVEDFMVKDIKYIWNGMTFQELKSIVTENKRIRAFPLVDSPQSMILLGSIQRFDLIHLVDKQIGRERRLQEAMKMHREQRIRHYEEAMKAIPVTSESSALRKKNVLLSTKPKFEFEIVSEKNNSLPASLKKADPKKIFRDAQVVDGDVVIHVDGENPPGEANKYEIPSYAKRTVPRFNKKSDIQSAETITTETESQLDAKSSAPRFKVSATPVSKIPEYKDVKPAASRFQVSKVSEADHKEQTPSHNSAANNATSLSGITSPDHSSPGIKKKISLEEMGDFSPMLRPRAHSVTAAPKKSILKKKTNCEASESISLNTYATITGTEGGKLRQAVENLMRKSVVIKSESSNNLQGSVGSPSKKGNVSIDMTPEEQKKWEEREMQKPVDLTGSQIDPAPFQLVKQTSLLKVHSIFSLMGVHHAYVTAIGKLIGVVALKELRKAIEDVNSTGFLKQRQTNRANEDVESGRVIQEDEIDRIRYRARGTPPRNSSNSSSRSDLSRESDSDGAMEFLGPGRSAIEDLQSRTLTSEPADHYENRNATSQETLEESDTERQNLLDT